METLKNKTVIVGVSGGIAAYKACALVSKLVQAGAEVHVAMTRNATEFVAPLSFETLSHNRVITDTFDRNFTWEVEHVALAKKADLAVVAPATANVIAKLACGIADDFLTTTLLACKCPVIVAPAMNSAMLAHPATAENIATLEKRGVITVYGDSGYLACGDSGNGRMAEPDALFERVCSVLAHVKRDLAGKTVLVTAGATRTALDPVRFITNRSSGKMGFALAEAAYARGARVVLVKGYTSGVFTVPDEWTTAEAKTTDDMFALVKKYAAKADICIMAAAPCDYNCAPASQKIKDKKLELTLEKAPDIAAWVGEHKKDGKLIVFAAETENCEKNALSKLEKKRADMVVLNDVTKAGAGFDTDTNIVTLITRTDKTDVPMMAKRALADVILDKAAEL